MIVQTSRSFLVETFTQILTLPFTDSSFLPLNPNSSPQNYIAPPYILQCGFLTDSGICTALEQAMLMTPQIRWVMLHKRIKIANCKLPNETWILQAKCSKNVY